MEDTWKWAQLMSYNLFIVKMAVRCFSWDVCNSFCVCAGAPNNTIIIMITAVHQECAPPPPVYTSWACLGGSTGLYTQALGQSPGQIYVFKLWTCDNKMYHWTAASSITCPCMYSTACTSQEQLHHISMYPPSIIIVAGTAASNCPYAFVLVFYQVKVWSSWVQ